MKIIECKSIKVTPDLAKIEALMGLRGISGIPVETVAKRFFRFEASTEIADHEGEVILASAWDVSDWLKNPVMLADHKNKTDASVGAGLDAFVSGSLFMDVFFSPPEIDPSGTGLAEALFKAYKCGIMRQCSVGFLTNRGGKRIASMHDREKYGDAAHIIATSVLLKELTCTPLGMNKQANVIAMSKSISEGVFDDSDLKALQSDESYAGIVERALFRLHPTTTVKSLPAPVAPIVDLSGIEAQIKAMGQHLANVERRALSQTQQKELGLGIFLPIEAAQKIAFLAESIEDEIEKYLPKTEDEEGNEPEPEPAPYTEDTSKAATESSVAKELQDLSRTIQKKD